MMHKIKVVLRKHDRLMAGSAQLASNNSTSELVMPPSAAWIRSQSRRHQAGQRFNFRRATSHRPGNLLKAKAVSKWEQVSEDRAKMIEMHAF